MAFTKKYTRARPFPSVDLERQVARTCVSFYVNLLSFYVNPLCFYVNLLCFYVNLLCFYVNLFVLTSALG